MWNKAENHEGNTIWCKESKDRANFLILLSMSLTNWGIYDKLIDMEHFNASLMRESNYPPLKPSGFLSPVLQTFFIVLHSFVF